MGFLRKIVVVLLVVLSLSVPVDRVLTQEVELAVVLDVVYGGVELQRTDTDEWLPLVPGAVMPVGAGDRIRTAGDGRVLLSLDAINGTVLVLPNTVFAVDAYADSDAPTFAGTVFQGDTVHRIENDTASYTILAAATNLTATVSPQADEAHMLVSSRDGADTLLVASGEVLTGDEQVGANTAFFADDDRTEQLASLVSPYNPSTIVGLLDGCPGNIVTSDGQNLNARIGPGTVNLQLGQFPDGAAGRMMGVTESGGWFRVQFRSGFGWVERLAVVLEDPNCPLPILPDDAFDLPSTIFNVTSLEQDLLQPFYGTPDDDPIFYQTARGS